MDKIVRLAGRPAVYVRERGERSLGDIPPSEIAAALQTLAQTSKRSFPDDAMTLFEELLGHYGLERTPDSEWQSQILERSLLYALAKEHHGSPVMQVTFGPAPHE